MGDDLGPNGLLRGCKVFCSRSKYPATPARFLPNCSRRSFSRQPLPFWRSLLPCRAVAKDKRWPTILRSMTMSTTSCRGRKVALSPSRVASTPSSHACPRRQGRLARAGRAHSGIPAFRSASTIRARRSADANAKDVKFALDMLARGLIRSKRSIALLAFSTSPAKPLLSASAHAASADLGWSRSAFSAQSDAWS